jgi:hypothetical protein
MKEFYHYLPIDDAVMIWGSYLIVAGTTIWVACYDGIFFSEYKT